jgi:hypothetical protein
MLGACQPDDAGVPKAQPIDECEGLPELTLQVSPESVRVAAAATLKAEGGSGRYTFSVKDGGSGGALRAVRFVAGPTPATDTLIVMDDCGASAEAALEVTAAFSVAPTRATVKPGTRFQIETVGTLGAARFSASTLASGGSVRDDGTYTAGPRAGMDLIVVSDTGSGEEVLLQYRVDPDAQLVGAPAELALPAGASITLETADGSGVLVWQKRSGPGSVSAGVYSAEASATGTAVLEARDHFTGERAQVNVHVLEQLAFGGRPHGRLTDAANLVSGDFDGDGIEDVALGVPESDLGRPTGGAVFVFRGSPEGLPRAPTWTLTGETDTANLGAVLAAGDLNGDGRDDLAISEPGADVTVADSGAVLLYKFEDDGPVPLRGPLTGLGRGNFGAALAIADVDGDDNADLIVGSPGADLAASSSINSRGVVDIFLLEAGKPIPDLSAVRLGGADLAADGSLKASTGLRFGRALAVADFNGDGAVDLASLGAVNNALLGAPQAKNQAAVAVHFGRGGSAMFGESPDLYLLPANTDDSSEGSFRLFVGPAARNGAARLLVSGDQIDSPDLSKSGGVKSGANAGGVYVFDLSQQAAPRTPPAKPTQIGRNDAFASVFGDSGGMSAGRSLAFADIDGDDKLELALGAHSAANTVKMGTRDVTLDRTGKVLVFPYETLSAGDRLNKPGDLLIGANANDSLGVAVAAWSPGDVHGLVAFAARASTSLGDFTGRLDAYLGMGMLQSFARSSVEIPAALASQQLGAGLQLGVIGGKVRALVGAPGYSGLGAKNDGNELGAGQALLYDLGGGAMSRVVHEGASTPYTSDGHAAYGGRAVGSDVAMTDFNGDGVLDLVVAAPQLSTPSAGNTEYAALPAACVTKSSESNGGALVFLAQGDGSFREGFRVLAPAAINGCTPADSSACKRSNLGRALVGGFDFDGDGKQDLMLTRSNGSDVFLGKSPDDASLQKPTLVCEPAFTLPALAQNVSAPAALDDLDGDGCAELSVRYAGGDQSGLVIAFGFAAGGRCAGHGKASWLRISGDSEKGLSNMQLGVAATRAGKLLGDARDFIAVSAALFPFQGTQQPAVLLFPITQLAAARPAQGEALRGALNDGLLPIALAYRERAPGFGRALAGNVDFNADGVVDLVVSAPGASVNGDGTGAVFIFAGGPSMSGQLAPWLTMVGDGSERASVGQDLSVVGRTAQTPATVAIGAPLSYRTGTANGTSWLLAL